MNDFNWRNQPSKTGIKLSQKFIKPAHIKPLKTGSIATTQKIKQRPGVGVNATS